MTRCTLLGAAVLLAGVSADPAAAASPVTFVSGLGTDTGACARTAPCRSFQYALGQTTAGGIVSAIDAAGYGAVTITQSVTLAGPGNGRAAVTPRGGSTPTGVDVQAPGATVVLRGLEIDGGAYGINIGQATSVAISDTVIVGSTNSAIDVGDTTASVLVQDTTVRNAPVDTNAASFVAKRVTVSGSGTSGFRVFAGRAALDDCTVSASGSSNIRVFSTTIVKHGVLPFAGLRGIVVDPGGTTYVDRTTTFGNGQVGILAAGQAFSYGNNNFPDGTSGTITPIAGD